MKERKNFIRYIIDNILTKAKKNETTGVYEIKYEDYKDLNLSTSQKKILREICQKMGIELESIGYIRMPLTCVEDENLFKEYNTIKKSLEKKLPKKEKQKLEQRRIEIRNQIVADNILAIHQIINRRITDITYHKDKEDIYQTGYELLINYIDDNYLYKGKFKDNIDKLLILSIIKKIIEIEENIDYRTKKQITIIKEIKEKNPDIQLEELSQQTNINIKKLKELLTLEQILQSINLDCELEKTTSSDNPDNWTDFHSESFEEKLIDSISKENTIAKMLSTLSKTEESILKLYYGFNGICYTMEEIASMYGVSKARISKTIKNSLETIKNTIRINYLSELDNKETTYIFEISLKNKKLEENLLIKTHIELFKEIKPHLNDLEQQILELYFFPPNFTIQKLTETLNISEAYASSIKNKIISIVRYKIIKTLTIKSNKEITYEEYLNYLMKMHLNKPDIKNKKRRKL